MSIGDTRVPSPCFYLSTFLRFVPNRIDQSKQREELNRVKNLLAIVGHAILAITVITTLWPQGAPISTKSFFTYISNAGGGITIPKQEIPGIGWFVVAIDPEGNPFAIMQTLET